MRAYALYNTKYLVDGPEVGPGLVGSRTISGEVFMRPKVVLGILVATAAILAVPLVAMQYNEHVVWGPADFVGAGVLLVGTGLLFELAASRVRHLAYQAGIAVALVAALLLVWINLAVGMIGNEDNPANLMYLGVLAVGFLGAVIARFQPRGMAYALFATATAHALVGVIVFAGRMDAALPLDAIFVAVWIASALLFRSAGAARTTGSLVNA